MTDGKRLLRTLGIIGSSTMISRVLGFVRDLLTAVWLGTGHMADAFIIAQRLPNLFRSLLAEGGINAVFVPDYNRALAGDPQHAAHYAAQITGWLLTILIPIIIIAAVFMDQLIAAITPGITDAPDTFMHAVSYSQVTVFYLIVICYTAMQGAVLSAHNSFGPYAGAPAILNVSLIAAMFVAHQTNGDIGQAGAWALLVGGVLQTLYLDVVARRLGIKLGFARPRLTPQVRAFFRKLGAGVLGMGAMNVNILVGTFFASFLPTGAIAALYYADRLNQLPLALIGASLGTVLLPTLTRALHSKDDTGARRAMDQAITTGLLLSMPVALGMIMLGEPLVRVLFEHGSFSPSDTAHTAAALAAYAIMLPAAVLGRVVQCCSYARHNTAVPARAAAISIIVHAVLAGVLAKAYGHLGIALALTMAAWCNTGLQAIALRRRSELPLSPRLPKQMLVLIIGCAVMLGIMLVLNPLMPEPHSIIAALLKLAAVGGAGLAGYGLVVLLCRKTILTGDNDR